MTVQHTPQIEDGHLDIANELVEQFAKLHLSGNEWQVLWAILRKTWGWHKKEEWISNSQLQNMTSLNRRRVIEAKIVLVQRNILLVRKSALATAVQAVGINKNYNMWQFDLVRKSAPPSAENRTASAENRQTLVRKSAPYKRKHITKETITKENIVTNVTSDTKNKQDQKDTNYFIDLFKVVNPSYAKLFANKTQRQSIESLRKTYNDERLEQMILRLPDIISRQYAPTVTTPYELEMKMGALIAFSLKEKLKNGHISINPEDI